MTYETIRFETADGIARLTLNRPDKLNSFTTAMHGEVRDALERVEADASIRVLILTGAGRGFCAGQDLADRAVTPGATRVDLGQSVERYYGPLVRTLRSLPLPVICAVNGVAAGAGANLALACDIVIAARSARFILSFVRLGAALDGGTSLLLQRSIGVARARALALLGQPLDAEKAEKWGLIWKMVEDADLLNEALAIAQSLADGPPVSMALIKNQIDAAWDAPLAATLDNEATSQSRAFRTADLREGAAAFVEKRPARFTGR